MLYSNRRKSIIIAVLAVIILVSIDQLTKLWAVNSLMGNEDFILIKGVLQFHYLENTGAAFSALSGKRILFLLLTPVLTALIAFIYCRLPLIKKYNCLYWICIFLIAGAIGNFIDRLRLSYVIDMIYFSLINFPVFNVADIYVTCSVALLFVLILFVYKEQDMEELSASIKKSGK